MKASGLAQRDFPIVFCKDLARSTINATANGSFTFILTGEALAIARSSMKTSELLPTATAALHDHGAVQEDTDRIPCGNLEFQGFWLPHRGLKVGI